VEREAPIVAPQPDERYTPDSSSPILSHAS
jgi:hypothetical protein